MKNYIVHYYIESPGVINHLRYMEVEASRMDFARREFWMSIGNEHPRAYLIRIESIELSKP